MKNKCHIGYKTLWEKKILVTSNFSFSQNVFYSYISSVRQNGALCGNGFGLFYGTANQEWDNSVIFKKIKI